MNQPVNFSQNIIIDGKINKRHLLGFIAYMLSLFIIQNIITLNMYLGAKANINGGILTVIWRLNVFMTAFGDFLIYKEKLRYFHIIGLVSITTCTILIGVDQAIHEKQNSDKIAIIPSWIPILICLLVPVTMTINAMLTKHLVSTRIGF